MTRKDYARIALAFQMPVQEEARRAIAVRRAGLLKQDNPRFDRKRFLVAAGFAYLFDGGEPT